MLHIENSELDAALLTRHLTAAGYDLVSDRVDTPEAMKAALRSKECDIILCDYSMPHFNALAALDVLRKSGLDIPLIIISGTVGEDVAVEAMLAGANDYLPKDNLTRLVPAIERELKEAENRRSKQETEEALKASGAELRALFEAMSDEIVVLDSKGRYLKVGPTHSSCSKSLGVNRIGKTVHEIFPAAVADFMLGNIQRALDEGRKLNVEYILSINGKDLWFDGTVSPISDDSVVWVARDITERKREENERRIVSEIIQGAITTPNLDEFLKLVHRTISQIVYAENCFVMLHDPVTEMIHYEFWADKYDPLPPPRPAGKGFGSYVLRTGQPLLLTEESKKRMFDQGEAEQLGSSSASWLGVPLRTPSRTIGVLVLQHYEDEHAYSERDLEFLSSVGDQIALAIERKRAEEALSESEDRYRDLVEHSNDLICTHDLDGRVLSVNQTAAKIMGYDRDALVGRNIREVLLSELREGFDDYIAELQKNGTARGVMSVQTRNGEERIWEYANTLRVEDVAAPIVRGVARDVTEQRQAEAALRESEERYRDLVENAIDMIYTQDLDGNYTSINRAAERITGYTREETLTRNMAQSVAPEQRKKIAEQMKAAILSGTNATAYELEIVAKDGNRVAVEVNTRIIHENGVPIGVHGIARDITEQKRAKDALKLFRALVDQSNDAIEVLDPETGRFLDVNEKGCLDLGYSREEFLALSVFDVDPTVDQSVFQRDVEEIRKSGVEMWEGNHRRKDGSTFPVEVNLKYVRLDRDYIVTVARDITERKLAEQAQQETQRRIEDIVNSVDGIVWEADAETFIFTFVSKQAERILGYPIEQWLNDPAFWSGHIHPEDRKTAVDLCRRAAKNLEPHRFEYRMLAADGREVWLRDVVTVFAEAGQPVKLRGIMTDITGRKAEEEARLASERKYQDIFTLAPVGIYQSLRDGTLTTVNNTLVEMLGYDSVDELLKTNLADVYFTQDEREELINQYEERGHAGDLDLRWKRKDGSPIWVQLTAHAVKGTTGATEYFEGFVSDITERKRAEEELRESEEKYRTILENIDDGYFEVDIAGNLTFFNDSLCRMVGYSRDELLGMNNRMYMDDENARKVYQTFNEIYRTGTPARALDWEIIIKDGTKRFIEASVSQRKDSTLQPIGFRGVLRDITERKRVDEAMRESEERFSGAFEFAAIGVALVMPDGRWLKVNRALCEMIGYSEAELLKSSFQKITHPDDLENSLENVRRTIAGEIDSYQTEKRWIHASGSLLRVLINISLVRDGQGQPRYFIAQIQDITQRIELEEQFRQSQKMEAVGVLAGGIAHDFNNLLTAINGYSDLTLKRMPADNPLRRNIEEVKKAGERAAELTTQLLAFSRKQVLKPIVHNLNTVISNIEKMLRRIIKANIELRTVLDPGLANVKADPGQVEQVIMNLAINARDAMPEGGTLTIQTENTYLDKDYLSQNMSVPSGPFVKLIVTDSGTGMDEETQQRIFEPFFTTKEVGKGTGLGLSTVYGIVKQSGGDIMVYSESGLGTTFKIYLPCIKESVQKPIWTGDVDAGYSGTETVLVVEDEEVVRNLVVAILSGNGYTILDAAGGAAALSICQSYPEPIHMLLTDVIMPKMGGAALRDSVRKLRPEIKTLFMSGYTDDSIVYSGVKDSDTPFIEKPFTPDALARKVREVLES